MSSINPNIDNIETSNINGIVGYSSSYISLQAVDGIFINGIGKGNTAATILPFSETAQQGSSLISSPEEGDFYISGQNGNAVIKSGNRAGGSGQNGPGIGSIHINSTNGDVVINVPNGNFESNVANDTVNNNSGNVTNNTTGNQTSNTKGDQKSYTWGDQYSWANGNQVSIVEKSASSVVLGGATQTVVGLSTQTFVGDAVNVFLGGVENIQVGEVLNLTGGAVQNFVAAYQINATAGPNMNLTSVGLVEADAEMKAVQAKLQQHTLDISSTNTKIRSMLVHLNDAGIHIYT